MNDCAEVSIIIPVYNTKGYLQECLNSLATQSFSKFEVILIDDGSTDGSADICREMAAKDPRFKLISQSNRGQSAARNMGMDAASGQYIGFVDSDDIVHPDYLATMLKAMRQSNCAVAGLTFARFFDIPPQVNSSNSKIYNYKRDEACCEMLYQTSVLDSSPWGKLFKRETIDGVRFIEGILYEDLEWIERVYEGLDSTQRVVIDASTYYFYRCRPGSSLDAFSPRRLGILKVVNQIEERAVKEGNKGRIRAARDRRLSAAFDMFFYLYKANRGKDDASCPKTIRVDSAPSERGFRGTEKECWQLIRALRFGSLFNPKVRLKNKLGIILSLLGRNLCGAIGSPLHLRLKK